MVQLRLPCRYNFLFILKVAAGKLPLPLLTNLKGIAKRSSQYVMAFSLHIRGTNISITFVFRLITVSVLLSSSCYFEKMLNQIE